MNLAGQPVDLSSADCSSSVAHLDGGETGPAPVDSSTGTGPKPNLALPASYGIRFTGREAPSAPRGMSMVGTCNAKLLEL